VERVKRMEEAGIIVGYQAVEERPLRLAQGKLFRQYSST
jgi:DNA-binding Lrp family transcriptional regulator